MPYEACCLGSINLSNSIFNGEIAWAKLETVVNDSVLLLNRILDDSEMPIPECQEAMNLTRKIGLGIMGLHDMLIQLGLPYDSEKGREAAAKVMKFIRDHADKKSQELGEVDGLYLGWKEGCPKRRNANLTTIAPTGTLSMIADCSSGIEPYYSVIVEKHVLDGEKLILVNKWFEKLLPNYVTDVHTVMDEVKKEGTIDLPCVPSALKNLFKGADQISPIDHVRMQAAMQQYVDSSISKTINMPNDATVEDVKEVYELAYKLGCKGITVYRDGSRGAQVLHTGKTVKQEQDEFFALWDETDGVITDEVSLPSEYPVIGKKIRSENKKWYINICFKDKACTKPFAIFVTTNAKERNIDTFGAITSLNKLAKEKGINPKFIEQNSRKCASQTNVVKIARTLGLLLRHNVPIIDIVEVLDKVDVPASSFIFRMKKLLAEYIPENARTNQFCPECGSSLIFVEGCKRCSDDTCMWSKCS